MHMENEGEKPNLNFKAWHRIIEWCNYGNITGIVCIHHFEINWNE